MLNVISTIDYLLLGGGGAVEIIKELKIGEKIESDHMPLEILWHKKRDMKEKVEKIVIDWSERGKRNT